MASLALNTEVLGGKNARHLLRRTTYAFSKALIDRFAALTPTQALDLLIVDTPLILKLPYDPLPKDLPDGYWTETNLTYISEARKASIVTGWWWYNAISAPTLKYKLSHFLSTRFTIEKGNNSGKSAMFYDHLRLLLYYSYGNYKTLAKKMTYDNSMLSYLNNTNNTKNSPNENYAREFLELFTIGKGKQIEAGNYTTYTEADVVQAAKVLTGIRVKFDRSIKDADTGIPKGINNFSQHNTTTKIFSSAFKNQVINSATNDASMDTEFNVFVEMVFSQLATAQHICRKLYQYFVKSNISDEVENDVIAPLAQELYNTGYEILPVVRRLLQSKHFYDLDDSIANDETIGGMIKSPLQLLCEICTYFPAAIPDPSISPNDFYINFWFNFIDKYFFTGANMILFDPDNVAGYPAYHQEPDFDKNWISAATLVARYRLGESLVEGKNKISGNGNIAGQINITEAIKTSNIVSSQSDPYILTSELCNALFAQEPDADRVKYYMNSFLLQGYDTHYWTDAWNAFINTKNSSVVEPRLKLLLTNILRSPESQIF
jgi:uncharacterized protein (DUF1800 family)